MSKEPVLRQPLEVALLNLNGLGLGYIHARRWIRWALGSLIGFGILVTAFLTNSNHLREWIAITLASGAPTAKSLEGIFAHPLPYMPWLWAPIFLIWPLFQAFDGWLLAYLAARRHPGIIIPWKKSALIAGSLILFVVLLGVIGYGLLGQLEYSAGMNAFETNDFTTAQHHFDNMSMFYGMTLNPNVARAEVKSDECGVLISADKLSEQGEYNAAIQQYESYLTQYSNSTTKSYVQEKIAQAHNNLALGLRSEGHYEAALDEYQNILNNYSETPTAEKTRAAIAETYAEWANQLRSEEEFQSAIEKYQYILNQFPETPSATIARNEIPATYEAWGFYFREQGSYQTAIDTFKTITEEYSYSSQAASAPKNIAETYIAWGKNLDESGDFIGAMDKFETAKDILDDPQTTTQAEQGYQTALHDLSHDSGSQGWMVINDAITNVCDGRAATSPAIGLSIDEPPRARLCHTPGMPSFDLPYDLNATEPGNFFFVIKITEEATVVQSCGEYISNRTGTRYTYVKERVSWKLELYSVLTGRMVKSNTFNGSTPSSDCPQTTYLQPDANGIIHETGAEPESDTIADWLHDVMK